MRTWYYGINSRPEFMVGTVTLHRRPWWLALAEWFAFAVDWGWLHKIPLPNWPRRPWGRSLGDDDRYTPREWWGDLGCVIHGCVTNPIYQWCWRHPRNERLEVEIGYERVRTMFYEENPEFFDHEAGIGSEDHENAD